MIRIFNEMDGHDKSDICKDGCLSALSRHGDVMWIKRAA